MKRIILFLLVLSSVAAEAQNFQKPNNSYGTIMNRGSFDSTLFFPTGCGVPTDTLWLFSQGFGGAGQKLKKFAIYGDSCGGKVWLWNPATSSWTTIIGDDSAMKNYGGAPGVIVDSLIHRPAADAVFEGLLFVAKDNGIIYLDTSAGPTAGWKQLTGGSGGGGPDSLFGREDAKAFAARYFNVNQQDFTLDSAGLLSLRSLVIGAYSDMAHAPAHMDLFDSSAILDANGVSRFLASPHIAEILSGFDIYLKDSAIASGSARNGWAWTLLDSTTGRCGFRQISGGGSTDTTSLSNRINLKTDKSTTLQIGPATQDLSTNRAFLTNLLDLLQVVNKGNAPSIQKGNYAGRPSTEADGALYIVTDSFWRVSVYEAATPGWKWISQGTKVDTLYAARPLYVDHTGVKDSLRAKNDSAAWNAKALQGFAVAPTTPTNGQVQIYNSTNSRYEPGTPAGGSQTLQQTITTGPTLTQSNTINNGGYHQISTNGENVFDSAHFNPDLYVADSITFFGTSISFGVGASDPRFRWTTLLANRLNAAEANYSVSGSSGQVDFLNLGWKIHMADRFHRWFVIEYGVNDIINGSNIATWDTAHYGPILRARVDSLISFYGYLAGQITLLSPSYINPATNANATLARQAEYFACIQSVATTRGCKFVDTYHPMVAQGGALGLWDASIHPGDAFHSLMTDRTAFVLKDSVKEQAQPLAVNGLAEFQKVKLRANDTATYKDRALLSDSAGNLKRAPQNLYAMNSVFFTQPQPINLNIGGTANFGFTPLSLPPAIPEIFNVNGTGRMGAIRITQGMVAGTTGASLNMAFTGGYGYLYTPNGEPVIINTIGAGQVSVGSTPIDNITKLSVTGSVISSGSALWKGGMSFNSNSGAGTYIGYNSGIGYVGAYDFTNSLTKPFAINYQGGVVTVRKNTDNGLADFQVNGASHFSDTVMLGTVHTGDGTMAILVYNKTTKCIDTVAQSSIGAGGFTPANPTGGVAMTASNGLATTYLRSDVTLALSAAIAPTWTALHTFNNSVTATSGTATGTLINGAFTAAANSDNLSALTISPTFTNGAFTSVNDLALRVTAGATYLQGGLMVAGSTPNGGLKNTMILNTGTNGYFETYNSSGTAIPCLINTIGGGAITLGAAVTANSNITASGYVAGKGGITTNNSAVSLGFSGGNGYLASYGSSAVAPLFVNYQGGNIAINTNTDNSTAALQILKTTNQLALHYDNTHYSQFLVNSAGVLSLTPTGITTKFAASTTAGASINIPSGTAPTSPNHGDTWTDANHLNIRLNGVTYQLDQQSGSGVTTVGTFSGSSQTNGASISTNTITFGPADATNAGMMTTGTQTIAGNKTFTGNLIAQHSIGSGSAPTSGGLGTNVTSVTVTGTDKFVHVTVVTSGNIAGTIATITFNSAWPNTPIPVISPSNTTTATAVVGTTGGYFIAAGVSTTTMNLIGAITGAGTYDFNIFVGGN